MAIDLKTTSSLGADNGLKLLGYGAAGAGKTSLIPTLPNPLVISAEGGLLSIQGADLPYIEVSDMETLGEAYQYAIDSDFQSIALDSISEIGEVCLAAEKAVAKDPRQAYGEMQTKMATLIRMFRDIKGKHVYMTAKLEKTQDEMGRMLYSPSMPGAKAGQALPYFFDIVFAVRVERDDEGNKHRALLTDSDGLWQAKDRTGKLEEWEAPNIGDIITKVTGVPF